MNKLQWHFNGNSYIPIEENVFESVVCEMVAILSRPRSVNGGESNQTLHKMVCIFFFHRFLQVKFKDTFFMY